MIDSHIYLIFIVWKSDFAPVCIIVCMYFVSNETDGFNPLLYKNKNKTITHVGNRVQCHEFFTINIMIQYIILPNYNQILN